MRLSKPIKDIIEFEETNGFWENHFINISFISIYLKLSFYSNYSTKGEQIPFYFNIFEIIPPNISLQLFVFNHFSINQQ